MGETQAQTVQVPPLPDDLAFLDITTDWDMSAAYHDWRPGIVVPETFLPGTVPHRVIVIANQKGGAGKTVTALELAMAWASRGLRVRLVDADPQAAALSTAWLRVVYPEGLDTADRRELKDVYYGDCTLADATYMTPYAGLYVVPSSIELQRVEAERPAGTETCLQYELSKDSDFDLTIIDCGPSLGALTVSALVAGDDVGIPAQADSGLDVKGTLALNSTIKRVRTRLNPDLRIAGVFLTDFEKSTLARQIGAQMAKAFPQALVVPVRTSVRLGEAQLAKQPLRAFAPGATTVLDYDKAASLWVSR